MQQPFMPNFVERFIYITENKTANFFFSSEFRMSYSSRDELQIKTVIDHDLKKQDEWLKKWLMSFNPDKTEIMLFSNTEIPELNFTFNGRTIQSEEDELFITTLCCRSCR
jgi:hypothetical protein